eukprot:5103822-Amphidinium_carterae.1
MASVRREVTMQLASLPDACLKEFFKRLLEGDRRGHTWVQNDVNKLHSMVNQTYKKKRLSCMQTLSTSPATWAAWKKNQHSSKIVGTPKCKAQGLCGVRNS